MRLAAVLLVCAALAHAQPEDGTTLLGSIGCLVEEDGQWFLTDATEPIPSDEIEDEVDVEASGDLRFHLIGTLDELDAHAHESHKVLVTGVIVEAEPDASLNLTSIKHVATTCP